MRKLSAGLAATAFAQVRHIRLWLVTVLTVLSVNAGLIPTTAQSAILLSPAWLQLQASPEALAHSRTNPTPQRLSSANSDRTSSHGENAQAAAPSSHAPSEARSLAKEGERAQRSAAERARGGGISTTIGPKDKQVAASQYHYDPRGHLIRQIFANGEILERQSDPAGNLFRSNDKTDRSYGPGGVIQQANGTQYTVDADGFLTKKVLSDGATWHYLWSPQGELTNVTRPDGKTVTFTYDNFGRRTTKTYDDKITEYIWDGDDLIHERTTHQATGQSLPLTTWIQEPGASTLAKIEGRKRYGIVSDHLGSPTLLATEAGRVAWQAQLDIYGIPREESAGVRPEDKTDNPWRFPGQYEDAETGLYYNRFRFYDPELGRYLSEDPIGLLGGEALFGYVHEPLGWWDPLGLACGPATKLDGKGRWRDANGKFARKPQVSKLAPLKGKRVPAVEKTLRDNGFTRTNPANPKNQRWVHPDRSEVQIHAYGGMNTTPYKAGNNAHAHKSVGKHLENGTIELDDSGGRQVHAHSDAAHIGLKNPANFPTVSGRSHGQ